MRDGRWVPAAQQNAGRTGQYIFRGVVDEEALKLCSQLPTTVPLVPFKGRDDGSAEEVSGLLPLGCRTPANRRAHGTRKDKVE